MVSKVFTRNKIKSFVNHVETNNGTNFPFRKNRKYFYIYLGLMIQNDRKIINKLNFINALSDTRNNKNIIKQLSLMPKTKQIYFEKVGRAFWKNTSFYLQKIICVDLNWCKNKALYNTVYELVKKLGEIIPSYSDKLKIIEMLLLFIGANGFDNYLDNLCGC